MSPKEVEWSIAHDCGCENHEWSDLSLCWQKLNAIVHDDLQDLAAQYAANAALIGYAAARCSRPMDSRSQTAKAGPENKTQEASATKTDPVASRQRPAAQAGHLSPDGP